jgi:hypothetical protein
MKKLLLVFLLTLPLFSQVDGDITVPYVDFPMKDGKGMYKTRGKCNMCHSFGYIINQGDQSKKFWADKIERMIVSFKVPMTDKDIELVLNYLYENYGNGKEE